MYKKLLIVLTLVFFVNTILGQVSLIYPKNNYVFDNTNIIFEWNLDNTTTVYHIQIASDGNFTNLVIDINNLNATSYSANNLIANQKYYWRVKVNNLWSEIYTFRIINFQTWSSLKMWLNMDSIGTTTNNKGEVFTLMNVNNQPIPNQNLTGIWSFGSSSTSAHYPWVDNNLYLNFGRSTRFTISNPTNLFFVNCANNIYRETFCL